MTRRKLMVEHCPSEAGRNPCTLELPSHRTPAQATAVFEFLEDLSELIWRSYGGQIQEVLRRDRAVTTSPTAANIDDGDLPFQDGKRLTPDCRILKLPDPDRSLKATGFDQQCGRDFDGLAPAIDQKLAFNFHHKRCFQLKQPF